MRFFAVLILCAASLPCAAQFSQAPFAPDAAQFGRAELGEVLGVLCPGQEYMGQESGCHVCPASSARAGARGKASIVSAVRGHFLKPDSEDLLLDLDGCGPALLTHSSSGWFVDPEKDLPQGACRKVASRSGRDGLICYETLATPDREEARLTFSYFPVQQKMDLLAAFDNTGGACDSPKRIVVQSAIQEVKFISGAGGKLNISIEARCRRGALSEGSRKACARGAGFVDDIRPAAMFRRFRVDYGFNGDAFSLSPASRSLKQAYDVCAADVK
jgi:hypothetical protein